MDNHEENGASIFDEESDVNTYDLEIDENTKPLSQILAEEDDEEEETEEDDEEEENPTNEEETEEEEEDPTNEEGKSYSGEADPIAVTYYETLLEKNLLFIPKDFEFDGSMESLEEALEISQGIQAEQIQTAVLDDLQSSLPPEGVALLDYMLNGGKDIAHFQKVYMNNDFSSLDINDELNQEQVLRHYLKLTTSFTDAKINKQIDYLRDNDDLFVEASQALDELIGLEEENKQKLIEETVQERQREVKEQKDIQRKMYNYIDNSDSLINLPLDRNIKDRLKPFVFAQQKTKDGKVTTPFGQRLEQALADPEEFLGLAMFLLNDMNIVKTVEKQEKKKAVSSLREKLHQLDAASLKGSRGFQPKPKTGLAYALENAKFD